MPIILLLTYTAAIVFSAQAAKCAFEPNNEAPENLTCTFKRDLRQSKDGFIVLRYCFENGHHPVSVLSCHWSEDLGHTCTVTPGYTFNASTVVSNQTVLGFQYLTQNIEGNYACQLLPPKNGVENNDMCPYKHHDAPKKTHCAFEPNDQVPEKLICTFDVDLRRTKHDFNVQRHGFEENKDPTIVLSCIWNKDVHEPRCYVAPGYTFDNRSISNKIVLGIQKSATDVEGRYMCQLIPLACEDECCKNKDVAKKTGCAFEPNNDGQEKLTCTCDVDSGQMKHNVSVLVFRYGKAPAIVFSGMWKDDKLTYPDVVAEGYTFDNNTNYSKIVLRIQNVTSDPKDVYRCQVVLSLGENDSNETCPYKENENNHADNNGIDNTTLAICLCVSIAVIVIASVITFLCRKRLCACCKSGTEDTSRNPPSIIPLLMNRKRHSLVSMLVSQPIKRTTRKRQEDYRC